MAAALALLPATAFAQGAGDDQYSDPFGSEPEQATPTATPNAPTAPAAPTATPPPAPTTGTASPPPAPAATAAPPSRPAAPTLPYTGVDARLAGGAGALLLGAGLLLRARLRE
jgi:hypothetical protein